MSIVINTPTSNIGRALATRLLDAGERVTALSRDKKKVDELPRGVRVVEGSFEEPALLAKALEGAEALFWFTPPPVHRRAATATSSERARRHAVAHEAGAPTSSEEQK